jgi:hypothetical protein
LFLSLILPNAPSALPAYFLPTSPLQFYHLTYLDHIRYHFLAGVVFAALKQWDDAADMFEIVRACFASPLCLSIMLSAVLQ